jgi:hypothetical protein
MICCSCKKERKETDFINNQKFCYRCEYQKKLEKAPEKQTDISKQCRICNKEIPQIKNLKKRQRSVFCSLECAQKGHKALSNNYWTRQVKLIWKPTGESKWNIRQK